MARSEVLAWVPVLFLGRSLHLQKGSTFLCNIFPRPCPQSGEVPKFFLSATTWQAATLPKKKACCHLTRQEVRCALARMRAETLPRWSVDRHQSQKIGHRASQQVSGFAKKKYEQRQVCLASSAPFCCCCCCRYASVFLPQTCLWGQ